MKLQGIPNINGPSQIKYVLYFTQEKYQDFGSQPCNLMGFITAVTNIFL